MDACKVFSPVGSNMERCRPDMAKYYLNKPVPFN